MVAVSAYGSFRRPQSGSQHPHGTLTTAFNSSLGGSDALFWLPGATILMSTSPQIHTIKSIFF